MLLASSSLSRCSSSAARTEGEKAVHQHHTLVDEARKTSRVQYADGNVEKVAARRYLEQHRAIRTGQQKEAGAQRDGGRGHLLGLRIKDVWARRTVDQLEEAKLLHGILHVAATEALERVQMPACLCHGQHARGMFARCIHALWLVAQQPIEPLLVRQVTQTALRLLARVGVEEHVRGRHVDAPQMRPHSNDLRSVQRPCPS